MPSQTSHCWHASNCNACAVAEKLRVKLVDLKKAHPDNSAGVTTCFQTMQKYLANIYKDPSQDKFRNIRLSNPAFQQRVGAFTSSIEALEICGFKVILHSAMQSVCLAAISTLSTAGDDTICYASVQFFCGLCYMQDQQLQLPT